LLGSIQPAAAGKQADNQAKELRTRKVLDDRYLVEKTIGEGRYAKVKLATDLKTQKQVAIKILKVGREHLAHASKE